MTDIILTLETQRLPHNDPNDTSRWPSTTTFRDNRHTCLKRTRVKSQIMSGYRHDGYELPSECVSYLGSPLRGEACAGDLSTCFRLAVDKGPVHLNLNHLHYMDAPGGAPASGAWAAGAGSPMGTQWRRGGPRSPPREQVAKGCRERQPWKTKLQGAVRPC